ncbi:hypothetical protein RI129_009038 [Pyrocoelia pectoralis]
MTPIVNAPEGTPEFQYTQRHVVARNVVERCNGVLKGRFRCILQERKLRYNPQIVSSIINSCAVLHNMCVEGRLVLNDGIVLPERELNRDRHHIEENNDGFEARRQLIQQYFQ